MTEPLLRAGLLARLVEKRDWDLVVIGGGATGVGVALDAAARGLSVALLEARDFATRTSSRATKTAHGGLRCWPMRRTWRSVCPSSCPPSTCGSSPFTASD